MPLVLKDGPTITPTPTRTATPTATPTSTPGTITPTRTPQPPSGPQDGGWSISSSNVPMVAPSGFRVSSGSITQFGVNIFPFSNPCSFMALYSNSVSISGNSFNFSTWTGDYTVSGTFSSSTTASGNIHIHNSLSGLPGCSLSSVNYSGSWSGGWANP